MDQLLTLVTTLKDEKSETLKKITDDENNKLKLNGILMELCNSSSCDMKMLQIVLQLRGTADIHFDNIGRTLLMVACSTAYNSIDKTKEILKYNPNIDIKDSSGKTAMDIARHMETLRLLVDYNIKQLNDKLKEKEELIIGMKTENNELKIKCDQLEIKNDELEIKNDELKITNNELTTEKYRFESIIFQLTIANDELKITNDKLTTNNSELKTDHIELKTKINETKPTISRKYPYELMEAKYEKCIEFLTSKFFGEDENNIQNIILKEIEKGYINYYALIDNDTKYLITQTHKLCLRETICRFMTRMYDTKKIDDSIGYLTHIENDYVQIVFSF